MATLRYWRQLYQRSLQHHLITTAEGCCSLCVSRHLHNGNSYRRYQVTVEKDGKSGGNPKSSTGSWRNDKRNRISAEYFQQAWTLRSQAMDPFPESVEICPTEHFSDPLQENDTYIQDRLESETDVFGNLSTMLKNQDVHSDHVSEIPDMRNPNERIDEILPEDEEEPRNWRLNIPLSRSGRIGKTAFWYSRKMTIAARHGNIKEVVDIFDDLMLVRDRVKPNRQTFAVLIAILGRFGYTTKAFQVFRKMKHMGLVPLDQTYTSLFNACANSPFPEVALRRANSLFHSMKENKIPATLITVKASMKAFAFCGDFAKAFTILDEAATRLRIDSECFDKLLMACISDKKAGFRRALQVWQKMREYKLQPSIHTFNFLIRSARDCGMGSWEEVSTALGLDPSNKYITREFLSLSDGATHATHTKGYLFSSSKGRTKNLHSHGCIGRENGKTFVFQGDVDTFHNNKFEVKNTEVDINIRAEEKQNNKHHEDLLSTEFSQVTIEDCPGTADRLDRFHNKWWEEIQLPGTSEISVNPVNSQQSLKITSVGADSKPRHSVNITGVAEYTGEARLTLDDLETPSGRLAMIGGVFKLLSHMESLGQAPNITTYTQLLACLPDNKSSEDQLLAYMDRSKVKVDVDFLNDIMMRRNMRHESQSVKEVLQLMSHLRLIPNMRTYAALALTCHSQQQALSLLDDMEAANLEPTIEVMGHLIYITRNNFAYKLQMLQKLEALGLHPNTHTIAVLEKSIALTKKKIVQAEETNDYKSRYLSHRFQKDLREFLSFYYNWLQYSKVSRPHHPWASLNKSKNEEQAAETDRT